MLNVSSVGSFLRCQSFKHSCFELKATGLGEVVTVSSVSSVSSDLLTEKETGTEEKSGLRSPANDIPKWDCQQEAAHGIWTRSSFDRDIENKLGDDRQQPYACSRVRCNLWIEAQSDAASCVLCAMTRRS